MGKPGRKPQAQVEALRGQITSYLLNGVPTAKIAESVNLSVHTVREHIRFIRKGWAEDQPETQMTRAELIEKARMIGQQAAISAARARGTNFEVQFMKVQIEVIDKVARLTGAYVPTRSEITGADGGAIEFKSDHEIDKLTPEQLAGRLRVWAETLEDAENAKAEIPASTE